MNTEKKIYKYIKNTLPLMFFAFFNVNAASIEEEIETPQTQKSQLAKKKKEQNKYLEKLFDENREEMEKATNRAKRRLKINTPRKLYNKK